MKTLVVFESVYGNTEKIARAIGAALGNAPVVLVTEVKPENLTGLDLLVVGSPTQAFGPIVGTKAFIKSLGGKSLSGVKIAAFDTRIDIKVTNSKILTFMVGIFGYAAERIERGLRGKGGVSVAAPEGFFVTDKKGPLTEGELERAAAWAAGLQ